MIDKCQMKEQDLNKQTTEIAVLQERLDTVDKNVQKIMDNHLPHIYSRLGKIESRMAYYAGGIVTASAIINYLLK